MKIEIGESLVLSYLKHIKKCVFYQTNWKVSSNWEICDSEKVLSVYDKISENLVFDVFKKSQLNQLIKQSEVDVIGMDSNNTIYAIDVAFHEGGLNYGSKEETKNRVLKKLLRSYLTLLSYFPDKNYELIFVSPKVHNATEEIIRNYFSELDKTFSNENVKFKYISNDAFRDEIVIPLIKNTNDDSDTNELFLRAVKLLNIFNLYSAPSLKVKLAEYLIGDNEEQKGPKNNNIRSTTPNFNLEFDPSDEKLFKHKLLQTKRANRTWYYSNGRVDEDIWDASNFTIESNLRGNINSNNKVRKREENGLFKLKLKIIE